MRRRLILTSLALAATISWVAAPSAIAHGRGCAEFGENVSTLATLPEFDFGQTVAGGAPLNDTVTQDQAMFCY